MEGEMNDDRGFSVLRRAVDDAAFFQRLVADFDSTLVDEGITDSHDREEIRRVMTGLANAARGPTTIGSSEQQASTLATADSFKSGLRDTVDQIERGFRSTMMMYTIAFYLGVVLILASLVMGFVKEKALIPLVFGGLGITDVILYFITKPAQDLQFSRARLAQLQAAFFHWFIDYTNWNGVLSTWAQTGKADFQTMKNVSATLMDHTEKTMQLIDRYCSASPANEHARGEK
jgi:hypothetical protein